MPETISILFGGRSSEHDASVASYLRVSKEICASGRYVLGECVYFARTGLVYAFQPDAARPHEYAQVLGNETSLEYVAARLRNSGAFVLNLLHGQLGEDGHMAGWARMVGLRGSFNYLLSDSIGMSKWVANCIVGALFPEVEVPTSLVISAAEQLPVDPPRSEFGHGWIVKPADLGASIYAEHIDTWDPQRVQQCVLKILEFSDALIQEFVPGDEYSCGLIHDGVDIAVLPVMRLNVSSGFYSHERKHSSVAADQVEHSFVDISSLPGKQIERASVALFRLFRAFGWGRFDYIMHNERLFFLEFNSIPGLMEHSLFPMMLKQAGLDLPHLLDTLRNADMRRPSKKFEMHYRIF